MKWHDVQKMDPIYLNLGGDSNCHPEKGYENYISVDLSLPDRSWMVAHDLREKIPLADGTVTRIHSEDFIEHIAVPEIKSFLDFHLNYINLLFCSDNQNSDYL